MEGELRPGPFGGRVAGDLRPVPFRRPTPIARGPAPRVPWLTDPS